MTVKVSFYSKSGRTVYRDRSLDRPPVRYDWQSEDNQDRTSGSGALEAGRPEGRGFKSHRSRYDIMDFALLSLSGLVEITLRNANATPTQPP